MSSMLAMAVADVPLLLLVVVSLVFAITRWQRHPLASMLLVASMVIRVVTMGVSLAGSQMLTSGQVNPTTISLIYGVMNLVGVGGLALLVAAVFADRPRE